MESAKIQDGKDEVPQEELRNTRDAYLLGESRPELFQNEILADIFEHTANSLPQKVAMVFEHQSLTYQEVDSKANLIAHHLIKQHGVLPGHTVGLYLSRGFNLLISQLAIAKCGAAWIPLDIDFTPIDRVKLCLEDAKANVLLTSHVDILTDASFPIEAIHPETLLQSQLGDSVCITRDRSLCKPKEQPAYFIYTSGSTGKPKGIEISQQSICHFLRSENSILQITKDDVVYQGFSVAFDMSFEEIWISYLVGATLWIAPKILSSDPERLPMALTEAKVTVLHAVPTLVGLFQMEIPTVRLINLGGEMCPPALIEKISKTNRRIFNTYGPSEITVSASLAELHLNEHVTIGTPLPNYGMLIVDEDMKLLSRNETGELCIFGIGLAKGYLGRPDLTSEKFTIPPKELQEKLSVHRMYRTGDLARIDEFGKVHCLGRVDDQVKIRGFRVELGEIEAVICDQPGIGTSAVILIKADGIDLLVAYCVASSTPPPSISKLREGLSKRLPNYMIPNRFQWLELMPRLTSGKIDRKALRAMPLTVPSNQEASSDTSDIPVTFSDQVLFATLRDLFPGQDLHFDDDFFADLGGHSLLASTLVSTIRLKYPDKYARLSVQQVYLSKTLRAISTEMFQMEKSNSINRNSSDQIIQQPDVSYVRKYLCGIAQLICLPIIFLIQTSSWLIPFFVFQFTKQRLGYGSSIGFALGAYFVIIVSLFLLSIIGINFISVGIKPGKYPLYGWVHFRLWLMNRLYSMTPFILLQGTPWLLLYYRCLGAKIGRNVHIGSLSSLPIAGFLKIEEGANLGSDIALSNVIVQNREVIIGKIEIGPNVLVGSNVVMYPNTKIESGAQLKNHSSLLMGDRIPANEVWDGSPAKSTSVTRTIPPRNDDFSFFRIYVFEPIFYLVVGLFLEMIFFLPIFPSFILVEYLESLIFSPSITNWLASVFYFLLAFPASFVVLATSLILAGSLKRAFGKLKVGIYSVHSWTYYHSWFTTLVEGQLLKYWYGIFETVYMPMLYRFFGAKVGKENEIATARGVVYDLVELGDGCFLASNVILGDTEIAGGMMKLSKTTLGNRVFLGNSSYV